MDNQGTDISQIKKYLNGELDARAMHQVELRAQADPFFMEALQGYEHAAKSQEENLGEIAARLTQRVGTKKSPPVIPYKSLALAASVLLVLAIGGLWVVNRDLPKSSALSKLVPAKAKQPMSTQMSAGQLADSQTAPADAAPAQKHTAVAAPANQRKAAAAEKIAAPIILGALVKPSAGIAASNPQSALAEGLSKDKQADSVGDGTPLNEMVVMQYAMQNKKGVPSKLAVPAEANVVQRLQGRADGLSSEASAVRSYNGLPVVISGRVIGKDNDRPLNGVAVRVAGTDINTITDHYGSFSLPVTTSAAKKMKLHIATVGYKDVAIVTGNHDAIKTIALEPKNKSLHDPLVIGQDSSREESERPTGAYPIDGWISFYNYLKENAISPDHQKGIVKLSFTVGGDGKVTEIHVTRGLSPMADQKSVELIQNGPLWLTGPAAKPEKLSLRIRFR